MTIEQKIQYLTKKLNNPKARYTDEELSWLINHIGDPDAKIRDELVCNTFGSGFLKKNSLDSKYDSYLKMCKKGIYYFIIFLKTSVTLLLPDLLLVYYWNY